MGWASRRAGGPWDAPGKARGSRARARSPGAGVERREAVGEGLEVGRYGVGLAPRGGALDHPRKVQKLQDKLALLGGELPGGNLSDLPLADPGPLEDARDAGVGVLHVEDGVLVRLIYGQLQVDVDLAPVRGPHVEVPRNVLPHLVQDLIQREH